MKTNECDLLYDNWKLMLEIQCLHPQAAIGAAFINIHIPLALGELTNVVSSYASNTGSEVANFLNDIRKPSLKLCIIYGLQVLKDGQTLEFFLQIVLIYSILWA